MCEEPVPIADPPPVLISSPDRGAVDVAHARRFVHRGLVISSAVLDLVDVADAMAKERQWPRSGREGETCSRWRSSDRCGCQGKSHSAAGGLALGARRPHGPRPPLRAPTLSSTMHVFLVGTRRGVCPEFGGLRSQPTSGQRGNRQLGCASRVNSQQVRSIGIPYESRCVYLRCIESATSGVPRPARRTSSSPVRQQMDSSGSARFAS